mmetsp:Transcript_27182/g.64725  ORF Transcript_27182/g.64725 Transcript_27182/m.64725 type:complete len:401 (+) Transcript_27182:144-1346(+)
MRTDLLIVMLRAANAFTGASHTALHHRASTARTTHFQAIAAAGDSVDVEQKFKAKQGTNARAAALMEEFDFPLGLAQQVVASAQSFPTRFWIVDDSGSMATGDGKMISTSASGAKSIVGATRWQEISADMAVAAAVSHEAGARTEFHPLNGGRPLTIQGTDKGDLAKVIKGLADLEPRGLTPLAAATNLITAKIVPMAPGLMMKNQRVCVVIATDGQPSDDGFQAALGRLQALPVWVVVRICTDEDSVIDYYNGLDAEMEAPMEVLDDLLGEAHEVCKLNRWLTYGPPMHTARFGMQLRLFDDIDERALTPGQVKTFCELLLGCPPLPEPDVDRRAFLDAIDMELAAQPQVFDPISKKMTPWIKTQFLEPHFDAQSRNPIKAAAAKVRLAIPASSSFPGF